MTWWWVIISKKVANMTNIKEYKELKELKDIGSIHSPFNIFKILKIQDMEIRHSAFFAWLINPSENHGLGRTIFDEFCKLSQIDSNKYKDIDIVTEKEGNIDILIKDIENSRFIIIENKYGTKEHDNQLTRYAEYVKIKYHTNDENIDKVYLDLDFEQNVIEKGYVPLTYLDIIPILEKSKSYVKDNIIQNIIGQYIQLLCEKYHILSPNAESFCISTISQDDNWERYKKNPNENDPVGILIHNFIWYTAPNKYNYLLKRLITDSKLKILHQWLENGSSLSLRCAENECDFHENKHIYIDHRNNQITMYFQDNINQQSQKEPVQLISKDDYFKNLEKSNEELFNEMEKLVTENVKTENL